MIEDTLLLSCPGSVGGLFIAHGDGCVCLSPYTATGLYIEPGSKRGLVAWQESEGRVLTLAQKGSSRKTFLAGDRLDLHDVKIFDGEIYAAATELNSVLRVSDDLDWTEIFRLPGEKDSSHLNSIAFHNGRRLASIFGRFQHHREYKERTRERGEVIDMRTGETVITGLSQPHSLMPSGELLFICSSEDHQIHIYREERLENKIKVPGYARGLAITDKHIYVGLSSSRNTEKEDSIGSATIAVIDRDTLAISHLFPLPVKEIYDIQIANDSAWFIPHLLDNNTTELIKTSALYERGYESYKRAYESRVHKKFDWL